MSAYNDVVQYDALNASTFSKIGMSYTGQYQTAAGYLGVLTSSNYGSNWVPSATPPPGNNLYNGLAVSGNGSVQYLCTDATGTNTNPGMYKSTDHGNTWSVVGDFSFIKTQSMATSSNGNYILICDYDTTNPYFYTSSDAGATWASTLQVTDGYGCYYTSMSGSGQHQIAAATPSNTYYSPLFLSSDYGATWAPTAFSNAWSGVSISGNGAIQYGIATSNINDTGTLWKSSNSGSSWVRVSSADTTLVTPYAIATSYNGQKTAISDGGNIPVYTVLYESVDAGSTFTVGFSTVASSASTIVSVAYSSNANNRAFAIDYSLWEFGPIPVPTPTIFIRPKPYVSSIVYTVNSNFAYMSSINLVVTGTGGSSNAYFPTSNWYKYEVTGLTQSCNYSAVAYQRSDVAQSQPIAFRTVQTGYLPGPVQNLYGYQAGADMQLNWNISASNGGATIQWHVIRDHVQNLKYNIPGTDTAFLAPGVPSAENIFSVEAVNDPGYSDRVYFSTLFF